MVDQAKKPAPRSRARKPAAPKAAASAPVASPQTAAAAEAPQAKDTATIKIGHQNGVHRNHVDVQANGRHYKVPTGVETEVNEACFNALSDSHIEFETISPLPGADGPAAPETTLHPGESSLAPADATIAPVAQPTEQPHELGQGGPGTDDTTAADKQTEANAKA